MFDPFDYPEPVLESFEEIEDLDDDPDRVTDWLEDFDPNELREDDLDD